MQQPNACKEILMLSALVIRSLLFWSLQCPGLVKSHRTAHSFWGPSHCCVLLGEESSWKRSCGYGWSSGSGERCESSGFSDPASELPGLVSISDMDPVQILDTGITILVFTQPQRLPLVVRTRQSWLQQVTDQLIVNLKKEKKPYRLNSAFRASSAVNQHKSALALISMLCYAAIAAFHQLRINSHSLK